MGRISLVPMLLRHRVDKAGKCQIVIRIYCKSKVMCDDKTGKKIEPHFWDETKREVLKKAPNAAIINVLIHRRKSELETEFLKKELNGSPLTKNIVKLIAKGEDPGLDFFKYCEDRIPIRYPDPKQIDTRRSYLSELKKLKAFQNHVSFGDMDAHFLSRYKAWMITVRQNKENTVWKTLKFIYTMTNDALCGKVIKDNPFDNFDRGKFRQGRREYMEISDINKIELLLESKLPEKVRQVAAYYLFMCYTGLRFQDAVNHFNPAIHIVNDERIIIVTQKSHEEVNIIIHDRLRLILEFVKKNPLKITNQEFNIYLKIVAKLAGISVNLTAHIGRHTFGAMLAEMDVPIERAQKLLGHRDKKSTQIYYHIKNKNLDSEMEKWNKL